MSIFAADFLIINIFKIIIILKKNKINSAVYFIISSIMLY